MDSAYALRLVQSYLSNREQKTQINENYNSWGNVLLGVRQGSIPGPIHFNILIFFSKFN